MKSLSLCATALLLGTGLCRADEPATISGTVTDMDGKPLAAATVILVLPPHDAFHVLNRNMFSEPPTTIQFVADERGAFRHRVPMPGRELRVSITAMKLGYLSARGYRNGRVFELKPPEIEAAADADYERGDQTVRLVSNATTQVSFRLIRGSVIRGVLRDHAGNPLAGIDVYAVWEQTTTDSQGRFEVTGAWPADIERPDRNRLYFFGGALLPRQEFNVPDDYREAGTPLQVTLRTGRTLSGVVLNSDGMPEPGAQVEARSQDSKSGPSAVTGVSGEFSIAGLPDGRMTLAARSLARRERTISKLDVQADVNDVRLQLSKARPWDVSPMNVLGAQLVKLTLEVNDLYQFPIDKNKIRGLVVVDPGRNPWSLARGIRLKPGDMLLAIPDQSRDIGIQGLQDIVDATERFKRFKREGDTAIEVPIWFVRRTQSNLWNTTIRWKLSPEEIGELKKAAGEVK